MTTITNAKIFDGERVIDARTVVVDGPVIAALGGLVPSGGGVIDARGGTLLPGLIDAHTHTSVDGLRDALRFGVTTELEMQGRWTLAERQEVARRDDVADVRSAGFGLSMPGGHPSELFPGDGPPPGVTLAEGHEHHEAPTVSSPAEAVAFVAEQVRGGADYIKIFMEEGTVLGAPGLPTLSDETVVTAVREAHRYGKLALAHTLTLATTQEAIEAGVDGLAHLFLDRPHTPEIIDLIAASGAFVTACLCLNASIMGHVPTALVNDPRVRSRLSPEWLATLNSSFDTYPQGRMEDVFATVRALHKAGVDVLVGTDVSVPVPSLGGLAHGASVHHELQLLVQAGLTPTEALRAATSIPARRFGLDDRGRIAPGARADLLLVGGDPTTDIAAMLDVRAVWRRGTRLEPAEVGGKPVHP